MRSGNWRSVAVMIAAGCVIGLGSAVPAHAGDLFHRAIPRETLAMDYRTGDVMMAPPIPYGSYAKDYAGSVHGAVGHATGLVHGLKGKIHGLGSGMHGAGGCADGNCGGHGEGLGHGHGHGQVGEEVYTEGGSGHGGMFHNGIGGLFGHKDKHGHGAELTQVVAAPGTAWVGSGHHASGQMPVVPAKASGQTVVASAQSPATCGGCFGSGKMANGGGCNPCGGSGKIKSLFGKFCGSCHGDGCGGCGGTGLMRDGSHGQGKCGGCGGKGCGLCGLGQKLCRGCGGKGCGLCGHLAGLKGKAHGLVGKLLHKGDIKYFVGPGGPVPITPGYVPYVVTTRSPRDFFAFPPFSDQLP